MHGCAEVLYCNMSQKAVPCSMFKEFISFRFLETCVWVSKISYE